MITPCELQRIEVANLVCHERRVVTAPPSVARILAGAGAPLEPALRQRMEERFDRDFSDVRVHQGGDAARSADDVNAVAYAVGRHIVFGAGRFAPTTSGGRRLLAHELTHVVQQTGSPKLRAAPGPGAARHGSPRASATSHSGSHLQRQQIEITQVEPVPRHEIHWRYEFVGTKEPPNSWLTPF